MRRAVFALRRLVADELGLEGLFVLAGTALLAVAASAIHPLAPFGVVGAVCLLLGLALAMQPRRSA